MAFELVITEQHWIGEADLSSHGGVRAVIGGLLVTDADDDYGIAQSALQLLRTLERDHEPRTRHDPAARRRALRRRCVRAAVGGRVSSLSSRDGREMLMSGNGALLRSPR